MRVDIVGGGISGFSSAISLKEINNNIDVNIFEKNKEIGYNYEGRKCGEAHTVEKEWIKWGLEKNSYYNKIDKGIVQVGNELYEYKHDNAFILNRPEFICQLSRKAENLGVNIVKDKKIIDINKLDGDYIIDASGCPSFIKKKIGFNKGIKGMGYQQTIENSNGFTDNTIKVWYTNENGYFWVFPKDKTKKEINLGYGILIYNKNKNYKLNLKNKLEKFKLEKSLVGDIEYEVAGLIPIGLQPPLKFKNILFVGDAGVGCFPFQGQGIYRALLSGEIAGKCIAKNKFNMYPYYIKKSFIKWDLIGKSFLFLSNQLGNLNKNLVYICWNLIIDKIAQSLH